MSDDKAEEVISLEPVAVVEPKEEKPEESTESAANEVAGNYQEETFLTPAPQSQPLDPFVRLVDVGTSATNSEGQRQCESTKKKSSANAVPSVLKTPKGEPSASTGGGTIVPTDLGPDLNYRYRLTSAAPAPNPGAPRVVGMDLPKSIKSESQPTMAVTPTIVKPRRPSVHFADSESKVKTSSSNIKPESGSRKHRSRKEKLVCRSESLTDLAMDTDESPTVSMPSSPLSVSVGSTSGAPSITVAVPPPVVLPSLSLSSAVNEPPATNQTVSLPNPVKAQMKAPSLPTPVTPRAEAGGVKTKPRVKRPSTSTRTPASRKTNIAQGPFVMGGLKEPVPVKKKKVIDIVSPRKRKHDQMELYKTSDPILVRAANRPSKIKSKSQNPFKFSRANLYKSSSQQSGQQRIRRSSSASFQQGSSPKGANLTKQFGSPQKRDVDEEPSPFPSACVDDLMWLLQEAEKEFAPGRIGGATNSQSLPPKTCFAPSDTVTGISSVSRRLQFGRRRVESEPPTAGVGVPGPVTGFDMTPGSPSGHQSLFQFRKEIYFSPSPSYAANGPVGRRRYSRRRHAKIHPPFDDSNCYYQGHHCQNAKVAGSQYCEKHLDQGPSSAYSHCRYIKDGRPCSNLIPIFDPTVTFFPSERYCEIHSNQIARNEYEKRNPKTQPDQAKNILAKISKICNEGFSKGDFDCFAASSSPDVLQIIEEPDTIQDIPLGSFTGGLLEELDSEGERNVNPDKPDYDALKNAGYYTTEEIIQIHIYKLRKLKALYQREKELEWLTRQQKLRFHREGLEKLKQYGVRFTTNPYLINKNIEIPKEYIEHQIREYDAAKAILQTAYKADGGRGLLRLKMLQKTQELARMAKVSGQKQHDSLDMYDSDTDVESDSGESRDRRGSSRFSNIKAIKCAYNEGYAVRACQNPPMHLSNYCFKHILSDTKQVQWVPCNRRIGPDPQDVCKTPCFKILEKHGCVLHSPLVMSKHKPLRRSEEELNVLADSDNEEEEVSLEGESLVLANLVSDECVRASHLNEAISRLTVRGPLDLTDTSDSEETDEEGISAAPALTNEEDDDVYQENHVG